MARAFTLVAGARFELESRSYPRWYRSTREPYGVFAGPDKLGATSVELHIFVDNVEAMYQRATDAGAEVLEPSFDTFHGDREVIVRDPFGHVWSFFEHLEDLGIDEVVRRGNELLRV